MRSQHEHNQLDHLIDQLAYFKTFPTAFKNQYSDVLRSFAYTLNEEDASFSFGDYLKALNEPTTLDLKPHSGGEATLDFFTRGAPKRRVKDIPAALEKGFSLRLENTSRSDFGSTTNFGISFRHILDNPDALSGKLIRHNLIHKSGTVRDSIGQWHPVLTVANEKVAFLYYLQVFQKVSKDSGTLSVDLNILLSTLSFLNFTSFWGFFTLFKYVTGDATVSQRNSDGLRGTNIYKRDAIDVLRKFSVAEILERFDEVDDNIFGIWVDRNVINTDKKTGYKRRLQKMLKRAL